MTEGRLLRMLPALLFVAAACLNPGAEAVAAEGLRLIVTHSAPPLVPNSVMDLAQTLGFYRREGVNVEIVRVQQTPLAVAALRTGYGDMANISVSALLALTARRQMTLKAVMSADKSIGFLIAGRATLASVKSLEGATLGVGRIGSLDHSLTWLVLSRLGVATDRIKIVAIGEPTVRAQTLLVGRIDATTMSIGTWQSLRDRGGLAVLVPPETYSRAAPVVAKVNVVDDAVLAVKRAAIERFAAAIIRASREFAAQPEIWADAMSIFHPEIARLELDRLAHMYAAEWCVNGGLNAAQLAATMEQNYSQPDFDGLRRVTLDEWVDFRPLDSVLRRLGTVEGSDEPGR